MPTKHICDKCGTELSKEDSFDATFKSFSGDYTLLCSKCQKELNKIIERWLKE